MARPVREAGDRPRDKSEYRDFTVHPVYVCPTPFRVWMAWTRAGSRPSLLFVSLASSSGFVWLASRDPPLLLVFHVHRPPCSLLLSLPCNSLPFLSPLCAFAPPSSGSSFFPRRSQRLPFLGRVPVLTVALHPSPCRFVSVSPTRPIHPGPPLTLRRFPLLIQSRLTARR